MHDGREPNPALEFYKKKKQWFENNHKRFRTVEIYENKRNVFPVLSFSDSVSDKGTFDHYLVYQIEKNILAHQPFKRIFNN